MSGILLQVLLYVIGAVAGIWFGLHSAKEVFTLNSSSSTTMIGDGKQKGQEKAEKLQKERASDPMYTNGGNGSATNMTYSQPQLPDMRGVDYGNLNGDAMNNPSVLKGMAMLGISPALIAGEMATKVAKKVGTKVDEKFEIKKKISKPIQWSKNKIYTAKTAINDKKDEFLDSKVKPKIKKVTSNINKFIEPAKNMTGKIQGQIERGKDKLRIVGDQITDTAGYRIGVQGARMIKGAVTGKDIFVNKLFAPKGTSARYYQNGRDAIMEGAQLKNNRWYLSDGQQSTISKEDGQTKIIIKTNKLNLMNNGNRKYSITTDNLTKALSLEQAFGDPQNEGLNQGQIITLAAVYRTINKMARLDEQDYQNIFRQLGEPGGNYKNVLNTVVKERPDIKNPQQVVQTTNKVIKIMDRKKRDRQSVAEFMTNRQNLQANTSNYMNNAVRSDNIIANHSNESDRIVAKQKAIENIERHDQMSLDEKEKEYEKLYNENVDKVENIADREFKKANNEYKDASSSEVREARMKFEMKESINEAIKEMYSEIKKESEENEKRDKKIRSFEGYMERRRQQEEQYQRNVEGSMSQAVGNGSIYIPRSVQEQMARRNNNLG